MTRRKATRMRKKANAVWREYRWQRDGWSLFDRVMAIEFMREQGSRMFPGVYVARTASFPLCYTTTGTA